MTFFFKALIAFWCVLLSACYTLNEEGLRDLELSELGNSNAVQERNMSRFLEYVSDMPAATGMRIEVSDLRSKPNRLGPHFANHDFTLWLGDLLNSWSSNFVDAAVVASPDAVEFRILKAYLRHVSSSMKSVIVVEVVFSSNGEIKLKKTYRGQNIDLNLSGSDSEYGVCMRHAVEAVWADFLNDLKAF